jgi:hypothetical protein
LCAIQLIYMRNPEIPHNLKINIITQAMKDAYQARVKILLEGGAKLQESLEVDNPGRKFFSAEKNMVFEAIRSIVGLEEFAIGNNLGSTNIPSTFQNLAQLTGFSLVVVREQILSLEKDGLVIVNHGNPSTFTISEKARKLLRDDL